MARKRLAIDEHQVAGGTVLDGCHARDPRILVLVPFDDEPGLATTTHDLGKGGVHLRCPRGMPPRHSSKATRAVQATRNELVPLGEPGWGKIR